MTASRNGNSQNPSIGFALDRLRDTFLSSTFFLPLATSCLIYSWNVDRMALSGLLNAMLVLCSIMIVVVVILKNFSGDRFDVATFANCLFIGSMIGAYFLSDYLIVWAAVWFAISIAVVVVPAKMTEVKSLVTSIVAALFCLSGYNIISTSSLFDGSGSAPNLVQTFDELPKLGNANAGNRDVYYIVMDRYARADQLREIYDFDNSNFLNALKNRGFFVAEAAFSNYQRTAHSLSSSLNLDYLDTNEGTSAAKPSRDWLPIYRSIENSIFARLLKQEGYGFHFLGSWWEPTRKNRLADVSVNFRAWPELIRVMFENSVFGALADKFEIAAVNPRQLQCKRAKLKFENLQTLAKSSDPSRPKFVFAHFLVPHPPFVLDADGTCLTIATAQSRSREENYVNQVRYANLEILRFLDQVGASRGPRPIIILQADEGPWPVKYVQDEIHFLGRDVSGVEWENVTPAELREKMGILNALYLPDLDDTVIPNDLSPVNNLRLVLREYFGADLPSLRDEAYIFPNNFDIYRFESVNDKLKRP